MRRGEVQPKPTLVALSQDSSRRTSTGESDGFTDNENSYDDTDGDTDGDRLVAANKSVPGTTVTGLSDDVRKLLAVFLCPLIWDTVLSK